MNLKRALSGNFIALCHSQDPQKAIKHLKICEKEKVFPAVMDLVRLEYQICEATDTVQRLEALLEQYNEVIQKSQILALLTSHHLFKLDDVRKACQYADEIIRLNGNYDYLTVSIIHDMVCLLFLNRRNSRLPPYPMVEFIFSF